MTCVGLVFWRLAQLFEQTKNNGDCCDSRHLGLPAKARHGDNKHEQQRVDVVTAIMSDGRVVNGAATITLAKAITAK